jgi:hypothetical protein
MTGVSTMAAIGGNVSKTKSGLAITKPFKPFSSKSATKEERLCGTICGWFRKENSGPAADDGGKFFPL